MSAAKNGERPEDRIKALEAELLRCRSEINRLQAANAGLQQQLALERTSEDKYRKIIESLNEGYFETDLEGHITFCNKALLNISGYPRNEIIGRHFSEVTTTRSARRMRVNFGRIIQSGRDAEMANYDVLHYNGQSLIIAFAAALIKAADGTPNGFRAIVRDVSSSVKASEKEKRMQEQLQQIQKMEALGTLAGGLAHGFNNMLMAIQGNLSLIRMHLPDDHPMQKHLERIGRSTDKGSRLAKEMLGFAKIGKYVVMPTDLNKILRSTARMFARTNASLSIREIYEPGLWQTRVDRVQIGQVMLSLYMNAAESMPKGGKIYLQSENVYLDETYTMPHSCKSGQYVKVSVTDSGLGLDEEAKRRIFEPFFTPYRPLRYDGLGLAAVYGIIKSHNGIINAYSEKGHGTTFTIYLPAFEKDAPDIRRNAGLKKGTETILIVDDDQAASSVGKAILERGGYSVLLAATGTEAIDIYRAHAATIHLVVLDIILPDMPSDQVFQVLRRCNANVQVILAIGYNVNNQISALLNMGCADFIQKPFQTQPLSSKVRLALDRRPTSPGGTKLNP